MKEDIITEANIRTALVAGPDMMARLAGLHVTIFGIGGVGSWCTEALARSGVGHITIVDPDNVAMSNINRQMPALYSTVGRPKVEVVAERISDINPLCEVVAINDRYTPQNGSFFHLETQDFVIDAIDSLADKADLILRCTAPETAPQIAFFSSMGAARKLTPSKIRTAEFWEVDGCPLARALRTRFRRSEVFPKRKFRCVYSPETLPHRMENETGINGTFAHTTAIFGLTLASMVIEKVY